MNNTFFCSSNKCNFSNRSKQLLIKFLTSESTVESIGSQSSADIVTFLRRHVLHIEDHFASFHYHNIRCFDEYSNTPLEGTNNGLKHCTHGVRGNMPLRIASVNMVQQDTDKLQRKKMSLHADMHKHRLCDLYEEGGSLIVKNAFGQLKKQVKEGHNYASVRTGQTTWIVMRSTDRVANVLPVFERKRSVTWDVDRSVSCDCGYTNRWGIPCRHIAHVVEFYSNNKICCFTHHDVDIRWWTIHASIMIESDAKTMEPQEKNIRKNIEQICEFQRRKYPIVDNLCEFHGVEFKVGKNSNDRFKNMNLDLAIETFGSSKSLILNYPESKTSIFTVGLTNTIYLGDNNSDSASVADIISGEVKSDSAAIADITSGEDIEDDSFIAQQRLISAELDSRQKTRAVEPHDVFGPLYREISRQSKGDTVEEINKTKSILQSIIIDASARRAGNAKKVTGNMVSCTVGNGSKEFTRFKHKKQKFF